MKRDLNLVREILLHFENVDKPRVSIKSLVFEGHSAEAIAFHVELMKEAELLDHLVDRPNLGIGRPSMVSFDMGIRPTMKGYDFLDSVRDPEIWRQTKSAANKVGGATFDFIIEIAKGVARQVLKERLGIEV